MDTTTTILTVIAGVCVLEIIRQAVVIWINWRVEKKEEKCLKEKRKQIDEEIERNKQRDRERKAKEKEARQLALEAWKNRR